MKAASKANLGNSILPTRSYCHGGLDALEDHSDEHEKVTELITGFLAAIYLSGGLFRKSIISISASVKRYCKGTVYKF